VRLLVVPASGFTDADADAIRAEIGDKLSGHVDIDVIRTDELALTARGKGLFIEQLITDSAQEPS